MKMTLMLCATILFCLLHLSASQIVAPSVSSSPDDQRAIPDDKKMFACSFIGRSIPHWLITKSDGTFETITSGTMTSMFKLPHIPEIVGNGSVGTVSQLEVTAALSLNGSTYKCQIVVAGDTPVNSNASTLTVYGKPLAPFAVNSRQRHKSVRVAWTRPWSSDLAPVESYVVELLESDGSLLETDTVDDDSTTDIPTDREKTFDNLIHNTKYKARVAAVNSVGQGPWSNEVTFTTPFPDPPPPPVDIKLKVAIAGGEATVTASWTAPTIDVESQTEVIDYTVFYGTGDFTAVTIPASVTSYVIPIRELYSTYQVKLTARNVGGTSAESGTVSKAAEYLQTVSGVGGLKHLDITCTFASSIDIVLQCSVELAGPTAMTVTIPKEISSTTAVKMVPGLDAGKYNITAKALRFDGSEASPYTTKQYLIVVTTDATETTEPPTEEPSSDPETPEPPEASTPEPSATPAPPVAPRGTTFTTQQIGIIAGVVVGVFLALILVPCCIFSCFVIFQK